MTFCRRVRRSFPGIHGWVAVAVLALPLPMRGQQLSGAGLQGLSFGDVLPGVPTTVSRTDPVNAARFEIQGQRNREVLISFLLPPAMTGPPGGSIPLTFSPGSAAYVPLWFWPSYQIPFDPTAPATVTLTILQRALIVLGGTASPPPQTPAGEYSAAVTMTLAYIGN